MKKKKMDGKPIIYENREISWLKFDERVLEEAQNEKNPLCERMMFLSVFQKNLDEFFMVRVGSLIDQKLLKEQTEKNKENKTPQEQIDEISRNVKELNQKKDQIYQEMIKEIQSYGMILTQMKRLNKEQIKKLELFFEKEIRPLLSVMIVGRKQPFPFLKGKEIYIFAVMETKNEKEKVVIIPCYREIIKRLLPITKEGNTYVLAEDMVLFFLQHLLKGNKILEKTCIRITRNADIDVNKAYDEDLNYREHMQKLMKLRKKLSPVRLEMSEALSGKALKRVCEYCHLQKEQVFLSQSPVELSFLSVFEDKLRKNPKLVYPKNIPQPSKEIDSEKPMIAQILQKDILLSYPYESMRPFLQILHEAAKDKNVISIRMTLYRLARNSEIVEALTEAAENGKQVDVLVELKARFDEENNIEWSRQLEDAGCHVVYGIDELKVHSKICLITRKREGRIQYITQIGTGNYNEKTARQYTDLSIMTASEEIGEDAVRIFQAILLGNAVEMTNHLLVAPVNLQEKIVSAIDQEIDCAKNQEPAYIGIKVNALTDKKIMDKLIEASQAKVNIDLIVRGICCLRSQIPGISDHIQIKSIVGRYLEHSRIYIFGTKERDQIYISSADFMTRNMERRMEIAMPVYAEHIKERIRNMFEIMWKDNVNARVQQADGTYRIPQQEGEEICAQEIFQREKR